MWMESYNFVYGLTRNPHAPEHSAGGSSGGEGAHPIAARPPLPAARPVCKVAGGSLPRSGAAAGSRTDARRAGPASRGQAHPPPPPPLVLIGHAASLTPY
jgi:hypothetical protein